MFPMYSLGGQVVKAFPLQPGGSGSILVPGVTFNIGCDCFFAKATVTIISALIFKTGVLSHGNHWPYYEFSLLHVLALSMDQNLWHF